ncbi:MAG TPA: hypothetical protein PKK78_05510 [Kouleothrix sp.]|jgi:hypothetical protein|nr:hypothetical protein [Kouleothrix sp.]
MPSALFLIFELGVYVLGLLCVVQAWRQSRAQLLGILAAVVYSFLTEKYAISTLHEYYYNRFLIMLCSNPGSGWHVVTECRAPNGCVPLAIPLMESLIIYAAMRTSDRFQAPWQIRPLIDGLLALALDIAIDPVVSIGVPCQPNPTAIVAHGLGFWVWKLVPTQEAWLGVDLNNFAGWFFGAAVFSLTWRLWQRWIPSGSKGWLGDIGAALLTILSTLLVLVAIIQAYKAIVVWILGGEQWVLFVLIVAAALIGVLRYTRATLQPYALDRVVLAVPTFFLFYTFGALLLTGLLQRRPILLGLWLAMFVVAAVAFTWPYWPRPGIQRARSVG